VATRWRSALQTSLALVAIGHRGHSIADVDDGSETRILRIEVRWSAADPRLIEAYASELVGLFNPDVLLSASTANLVALLRATRSIPIVFTEVSDPVAQGFVPNLSRPGGNITGFANPEFSIGGKWVDLLKQMVPSIVQVAFVYNLETSPQSELFATAAEAAAPSLGVQVVRAAVDSTVELEATLGRLARLPNAGLVFPIGLFTTLRAKLIVETVARYRLPAIYAAESFMAEGGLMWGSQMGSSFIKCARKRATVTDPKKMAWIAICGGISVTVSVFA
jgi:putative ABC transport system substrate-binding protein